MTHDPFRAALELREELSSDKRRLGFFFGAGTSMAVGVPGIDQLTTKVEDALANPFKKQFNSLRKGLTGTPNVEDVLSKVRLCRELLVGSASKEFEGLDTEKAIALDAAICSSIYDVVSGDPPEGLGPYSVFAQWLHATHRNRDYPVEVFTTNYDLLLERAMEKAGLPFFDGFVGSLAPFFVPESVEADGSRENEDVFPPRSWTRLWKLHGSIGWHLLKENGTSTGRIARLAGLKPQIGDELMIFPSREKYADSRRLPFLTYQDKLRRFLSTGEAVLFVVGYSFSDDHINEILFQGLRSNSRLAITVLAFGVTENSRLTLPAQLATLGLEYRNLGVYGPDKAVIGGISGCWSSPSQTSQDGQPHPYWDKEKNQFTLGDFTALASYLERFIGFHPQVSAPERLTRPDVSS